MKSIDYKSPSGILKNIPRVISLDEVTNAEDTILSQKFQQEGCTIEFPQEVKGIAGNLNKIVIPPCPHSVMDGMIVLDDLALKVNNLLRVMELQAKGEKELKHVSKSLIALQILVIGKITQKSGILNRDIIGSRMFNTARAVLTPSIGEGLPPEYVRLPRVIGAKLKLQDGDYVIIGRDPTIWHGSIEVLIASFWDHKTIGLNPVVYPQLGADNDGDTVWVLKVPKTAECLAAAKKQVLSFTKSQVKKISRANTGQTPVDINWEVDNIASTFRMSNGFSISPRDIIAKNNQVDAFEAAIGKKIKDEAFDIAKGLSEEEFRNYLLVINRTMLTQKVYLGPIGAASNKLKLIATVNPNLLLSANILSERLQQLLFDFKGVVNSANDSVDIFDFYSIIAMNKQYRSDSNNQIGHTQVLKRLNDYGLDLESVAPIIIYIYTVYHLIEAFKAFKPYKDLKENGTIDKLFTFCSYQKTVNEKEMKDEIAQLCKENGLNFNAILYKVKQSRIASNLGAILNDPIYNLTNQIKAVTKDTIGELRELKSLLDSPGNSNLLTSQIIEKASNV